MAFLSDFEEGWKEELLKRRDEIEGKKKRRPELNSRLAHEIPHPSQDPASLTLANIESYR